MKLKEGFIRHEVGSKHLAIATGKSSEALNGMVRSNETADFIFCQLMKETTEEQIVDAVLAEYEAPKETVVAAVHKIVAQIREEGLLDE